jgi:hypothetical protein
MSHCRVTSAALLALGVALCGSGCALQSARAAGAVDQRVERAASQAAPLWDPEERNR